MYVLGIIYGKSMNVCLFLRLFWFGQFWNGKMAVGMFLDDSCLGFGHLIETGDS